MRHQNVNGHILGTGSRIQVGSIDLALSYDEAYALCNLLTPEAMKAGHVTGKQREALLRVGRDLGVLVDHPSRDNLGKFYVGVGEDVELQLDVAKRKEGGEQ